MNYRQVVQILKKAGYKKVSSNGSHVYFKKPGYAYKACVPNHGGKDLSLNVIKGLQRGTGLSFQR